MLTTRPTSVGADRSIAAAPSRESNHCCVHVCVHLCAYSRGSKDSSCDPRCSDPRCMLRALISRRRQESARGRVMWLMAHGLLASLLARSGE